MQSSWVHSRIHLGIVICKLGMLALFPSYSLLQLVREALASGRITIARPGGILYRMLIHQVYPLSPTTLGFQQGRLPLKLNFYLYLRLDLK